MKRAKGKAAAAKAQVENPYTQITSWFNDGNTVDILANASQSDYENSLLKVKGLKDVVKQYMPTNDKMELAFWMEFALHGLAETSQLSVSTLSGSTQFKDLMGSVFNLERFGEEEDES